MSNGNEVVGVDTVFPPDTQTPITDEEAPIVPSHVIVPEHSAIVEPRRDPEVVIQEATRAAKALQSIVKQTGLAVNLGGTKDHLMFEAWQTIGAFNNATSRIAWTRRIEQSGIFHGYEAKAEVVKNGQVIASAESMCTKDEPNWNNRKGVNVPEFQLRSMAQTRASAKALRTSFAWVAVLAGYSATPAEEMVGNEYQQTPVTPEDKAINQVVNQTAIGANPCQKCKTGQMKLVPAGMSKKTGRPYKAFYACTNPACKNTQRA